jgi:hypothetical protein
MTHMMTSSAKPPAKVNPGTTIAPFYPLATPPGQHMVWRHFSNREIDSAGSTAGFAVYASAGRFYRPVGSTIPT